ncbi:MAG TPA: hypothetical protein VK789_33590 [Bryobacteraceae bacterium]|nr:hypothetical protein [Bryobacteraceae bacterium]
MKKRFYPVAFIVLSTLASASLLQASDWSRYRDFHLGSSVADVAKQTGMESSEAKLISSRPERIEELDWRTNRSDSNASRADSVREIRFRFYDGSLFEMMVAYDGDQTGGMTDTDMTEALSTIYGPSSTPVTKEMVFNSGYTSAVRTIAQWGDTQNVLNLVGFTYGRGFGLIVSSSDNQTLARRAMAESERLDRAEAPQRALDQQAKQVADNEAKDEKSRLVNKPGFRP